MTERPYEKLIAWKEAHHLCLMIYKSTSSFPSYERFALANQMRKASYSVPTNIAEGNARRTAKEKSRFFEISLASLEELHYQCKLASELGYMTYSTVLDDQINKVSYLLSRLRSAFKPSSIASISSKSF